MSRQAFQHNELYLPNPDFGSPLASLIIELEHLRKMRLSGSTHLPLFLQLKELFHTLESIGSARIEGNNTTISEFIETQLEERPYVNEDIEEIRNIEKAIQWVEEVIPENPIDRIFLSELHKKIVNNLTPPPDGEGDHYPGTYRKSQVAINRSDHVPPPPYQINQYMEELIAFANEEGPSQYDLLRIAVAHHRFMWIHPFGNGNGRTGRLFTYAMLVKAGFRVDIGQILNPTAVFCIDRERYNEMLSKADTGTEEALTNWCMYVLEGLKKEIEKIESLTNQDYVYQNLLIPALEYSLKMRYIDDTEYKVLKTAARDKVIRANDVKEAFPGKHAATVSRKLKTLRDKKMLEPEKENSKQYHISFINNFLIRGMIHALEQEGYIPLKY